MGRGYPPSLELTDIFDDSDGIAKVPLDDALKTPIIEVDMPLSNPVATTTSSPLLSTMALALTDSKT